MLMCKYMQYGGIAGAGLPQCQSKLPKHFSIIP